MSSPPFKHEKSNTSQCQMTVAPGHFWQLIAVYSQVYEEALAGHFSYSLTAETMQFSILLTMLCVILFKCVKLPGVPWSKALLRVAEAEGKVVGHTFLLQNQDKLEMVTCVVTKEYRRSGIGKMLVNDAVKLAGKLPVEASCMPKSHSMSMMLRKFGFVETGRFRPGRAANVTLRQWQYSQPS